MQFRGHRPYSIYGSYEDLRRPLSYILENLCVDGRIFATMTGRGVVA